MIEDRSQLETVEQANSGCWTTIGVHGDLTCPELTKVVHCWNCSVFHSAARLFFDRPTPVEYRAERTRELAEPDELEDKHASSLLVFRLGSEWLALELERVVEATAVRPVHSIPRRSNKVLLGLVNLRGRLQLCISLHGLLDVAGHAEPQGQATAKTRLVVIEGEGGRYVFPSDEVVGVERVPQSELRGVPATLALSGSGYVESTFVFRGATTGVLEPGKLFQGDQGADPMSGDLSGFSLIDLFRMEAEVQTEVLSSGLLALEKNAADPVVLESLMRAAHSLKGAARIVDLDAAVSVAHKLEDCFVAAQRGKVVITKENVDALLAGVDLLSRISKDPEAASPEWPEAHQDELLAFDGGIERILKNAPAAQPPAAPLAQPAAPARLVVSEAVVDPSVPDDLIPAAAPNAPEEAAPADAEETRVVRVTAASMTRLTALAGESLVQSRGLAPFLKVLDRLRQKQTRVLDLAGTLDRGVGGSALPALARDLFDQFKEEASEMLVQINDCRERFEDLARKSEDLSTRLEHEVLANRMRPISDALKGLPRLARDLSRRLGKSVELVIVGESTGVDRDILDRLEAPLSHLLRNAIDHAVEAPDERRKAGKAETSRIRIEAGHRGGMLHVAVQDDGKGIDVAGLRRKVVEKGLLAFTAAQRLSEQELLDFLFLPGFSTKEEVTEISGRGVGLDVAAATAREVGGSIGVSTKLGKGTRFVLQLPITTSIVRALLVEIAGEPYAFPLNRIDRILLVNQADLQDLQGRQHCLIDGQPVGLVSASQVLAAAAGNEASDPLPCVVVSDRAHRFALAVDRFLGERDLDVRPIDPRLGRVANFNSASLLDDGWPVLIFDVDDLVRSIVNLSGDRRLERIEKSIEGRRTKERGEQRVLVVEDSITVRELERQILEARGYTVDTAVDGADGWNLVRTRDYRLVITDVDMPRMDGFELVRLIRSDPRISSIPVVIVSYKEGDEHKMRGLDVGASAYLTKSSFRDQTFMETVVDLIGEAQA